MLCKNMCSSAGDTDGAQDSKKLSERGDINKFVLLTPYEEGINNVLNLHNVNRN